MQVENIEGLWTLEVCIQENTREYNRSILDYTIKTDRVGYFSRQALFQLALFDDFGARMSEVESLLREVPEFILCDTLKTRFERRLLLG